ncbi:MAG: helix-turn-helix domain-containing protein [Malacoplasma sp.]
MANKINNEIHIKSKQLTGLEKQAIYSCLERGMNLTDTSKYIKCDVSTIKKEIDRNKHLKTNQQYKNQCGLKLTCSKFNICGNTYCTHACHDCRYPSVNCNNHCSEFTRFPKCKKLKHLCGVCNGCDSIQKCSLNKYLYDPIAAHANHVANLKESHSGVKLSQNELKEFADFLIPLINHNISLCIIKSCHPDKFPYSIQSVYNWVDLRVLPGIDNIMLPRKVKYAKRKQKAAPSCNNKDYLKGRLYDDFIQYVIDHPNEEVVEMDTVEGPRHSSFIMTLLFRRSNFMLAFKLIDHTASSIVKVFDMIKEKIGIDTFKCKWQNNNVLKSKNRNAGFYTLLFYHLHLEILIFLKTCYLLKLILYKLNSFTFLKLII